MKKIIYIMVLAVVCGKLSAQNDTLKLSLEQAIQIGMSNRFDVKGDHLNTDIARNRLIKTEPIFYWTTGRVISSGNWYRSSLRL